MERQQARQRPVRPWYVRGGIAAVMGALALAALSPGLAGAGGPRLFGDVSVFASAPAPGHPFGIAVDGDRVYVSTSAGDFFAGHQNSDDERVFAYDDGGTLVGTTVIDTAENSDMGLFGLALDGNSGRNYLYLFIKLFKCFRFLVSLNAIAMQCAIY